MARQPKTRQRNERSHQRLFNARRHPERARPRTLLLEQIENRVLLNADPGLIDYPASAGELAAPTPVADIRTVDHAESLAATNPLHTASVNLPPSASPVSAGELAAPAITGRRFPQVSAHWFGTETVVPRSGVSADAPSSAPRETTMIWQGRSATVVPGEWIVQFSEAATENLASISAAANRLVAGGLPVVSIRGLGMQGLVSVSLAGDEDAARVSERLTNEPGISFFEPATIVEALATPNDPSYPQQAEDYHTDAFSLGLDVAWDITTGSEGVVVGLLDTGLDVDHADLRDNLWSATDAGSVIHGRDFVDSDNVPQDDNGHGTHVAGIVGAQGNNGIGTTGIAWDVSLLGLKVLGADGSGSNADIAAGINYATMLRTNREANVRVLNASFASSLPSDTIRNAIQAAGDAGIMLVTAAGNAGEDLDEEAHQSFPAEYPLDNIIVVANVLADGSLAPSSNRGARQVDIAAPGTAILSTTPDLVGSAYAELSGTSMSAPAVSGALALAWSIAPDASPGELKQALLDSASTLTGLAGTSVSEGVLDVNAFLLEVVLSQSVPPVATLQLNGQLDESGDVSDVRLTPDGQSAVYVADADVDGREQVLIVDAAGGPVRQLTNFDRAIDIRELQISPNSEFIVFQADVAGVTELYRVPTAGGAVVKLNAALVSRGDVLLFKIGPNSDRVVYLADQEIDGVQELYTVPITGGDGAKLHTNFSAGSGINFDPNAPSHEQRPFDFAADGAQVVFMADPEGGDRWQLYGSPVAGGTGVRLNADLAEDQRVVGFDATSDSGRIVYSLSTAASPQLRSVESTGEADRPLALFTQDHDFHVSPTGEQVVYSQITGHNRHDVFAIPITSGRSTNLTTDMPGFASTRGLGKQAVFSPDGSLIVFPGRPTGGANSRTDLYFSSLDGTRQGTITAGLDVESDAFAIGSFVFAPDGSRGVFEAVAETTAGTVRTLYSTSFDDTAPTLLKRLPVDATFLDTHAANGAFDIGADSNRVVFAADEGEGHRLYSVPLSGGAITKLTPEMVPGGQLEANYGAYAQSPDTYQTRSWGLTPGGSHVVYVADQDRDEQFELFSVRLDGSGPRYDFGDAPDSFQTMLATNGARHLLTGPTLGAFRDAESAGQPSAAALADDKRQLDDDDGVTWSDLSIGQQRVEIIVDVRNVDDDARLDAWIDFDQDGHWSSAEQIAQSLAMTNGQNTITFDVPSSSREGSTYARFRLSTTGGLTPAGPADDGEVEDYRVTIDAADIPAGPFQIVAGPDGGIRGAAGEEVHFTATYRTSDGDESLSGLGLRLHYDSSKLTFDALSEVLETNFVQLQGPLVDQDNFDDDAQTDKFLLVAWSDPFGGNWPNRGPTADLFRATFTLADDLEPGDSSTINWSASSTAAGYDLQALPVEVRVAPSVTLDVDGNCAADALTDGVMILRSLFGFSGDALIQDVLPPDAVRTDPADIVDFLALGRDTMLDVDGNDTADALTDGVVALRYLFGFTGDALVNGALATDAARTDPVEIKEFLDSFQPNCATAQSAGTPFADAQGRSSIASDDARQVIVPSEPEITVTAAGDQVSFNVDYSTIHPVDATLSGLGLRVHFDSSRLDLLAISDVLGTNFVQQQGPLDDATDLDDDVTTDKFVLFAWSDPFGGNWPGALPATLFTPSFQVRPEFASGATAINFTASSTAAGFGFSATSVTVNYPPANSAPTLTTFDGPVQVGAEDQLTPITFDDLAAHGDEADEDGTVEAFVIKSVAAGMLKIGSTAASATPFEAGENDVIDATRNAYWMPPPTASGVLDAFAVAARDDDGAESAPPITARVQVDQAADPTDVAAIAVRFQTHNGTPIDSVAIGQEFQIVVSTQDLRQTGEDRGAFGAIMDVVYDTSLIDVKKVTHLSPFTIVTAGDVDDPAGRIDDVGGLDGLQQPDSRAPQDVFVLDALATAPGNLVVATEPGEDPVIFNLLFGIDGDVTGRTEFGQGSLNIVTPAVSVADHRQLEGDSGDSNFEFTVSISHAPADPVVVEYQTLFTGTADTADLTDTAGSLTFTPEGPQTQVISIPVSGDLTVEVDETFELGLTLAGGTAIVADASGLGTIANDDQTAIGIADASQLEGDSGTSELRFEVTLSQPVDRDVTVIVDTVAGTAAAGADFTAFQNHLVTFSAGQLSQTVTVDIIGDTLPELAEQLTVILRDPRVGGQRDASRVVLGDDTAVGTILPDDAMLQVDIEFRDLAGEPLLYVPLGQPFEIVLSAQDLRQSGTANGVFGALADVLYDTTLIDVTRVRHVDPFTQTIRGKLDEQAGLIDDAGGIQGLQPPASRDPQPFLALEAVGVAAGELTVTTRAGEDPIVTNLLFGIDDDVTTLTDFRSRSLQLGLPDVTATAFDVDSDHVLQGRTTATVTVTNQGDVAADAFSAHIYHSLDAEITQDDDLLAAAVAIPRLDPGESTQVRVDVQLDVAALFERAKQDDTLGGDAPRVSTSREFLGVVLDPANDLLESDKSNNGNLGLGIDQDDFTYFPWDVDSDGIVSGLDAIFVLNRLGKDLSTADGQADLDGNGQVNGLDAIAIVNRFGYLVNSQVFENPSSAASFDGQTAGEPTAQPRQPQTDVNGDGQTTAIDALLIANAINRPFGPPNGSPDVNDDGNISPADFQAVVEQIESDRAAGLRPNATNRVQSLPSAVRHRFATDRGNTIHQDDLPSQPQAVKPVAQPTPEVTTSPSLPGAVHLRPTNDSLLESLSNELVDPMESLDESLDLFADEVAALWDRSLASGSF